MKQVAVQADDANLVVTVLTALRKGAQMIAAAILSNLSISRTISLGLLLVLASCEAQRPSFLTRVHEDCVHGDPWACGLLTSLARARSERSAEFSTIESGE